MTFAEKLKFSVFIYLSYKRIYKFNPKALGDALTKYYWLDGNSYNIIQNKWKVEDGIPLGLYTAKLKAGIERRVNITGMCEYCFALAELEREEEQTPIIGLIEKYLHRSSFDTIEYAVWKSYVEGQDYEYFMDGMGQGQLLSLFTRYAMRHSSPERTDLIHRLANSFLLDISHKDGFVLKQGEDVIFEEYSRPLPPTHVLNGWIYALTGLADYISYCETTNQPDAFFEQKKSLLKASLDTLERYISQYDLGYWSTYEYPRSKRNIASIHYHVVHIAQLEALMHISGREVFNHYRRKFLRQYYNPLNRVRAFVDKVIFCNLLKYKRLYKWR